MVSYEKVKRSLTLDTSSPTMLRWGYTSKDARNSHVVEGAVAGNLQQRITYPQIMLGKSTVSLHVAVWMLANGRAPHKHLVIDHIDGNTKNCHPDNLQEITQQENVRKGSLCRGVLGFSWYAKRECWRVRIRIPGQSHQRDLGNFKSMLDARAAYLRAVREVYYRTDL